MHAKLAPSRGQTLTRSSLRRRASISWSWPNCKSVRLLKKQILSGVYDSSGLHAINIYVCTLTRVTFCLRLSGYRVSFKEILDELRNNFNIDAVSNETIASLEARVLGPMES